MLTKYYLYLYLIIYGHKYNNHLCSQFITIYINFFNLVNINLNAFKRWRVEGGESWIWNFIKSFIYISFFVLYMDF